LWWPCFFIGFDKKMKDMIPDKVIYTDGRDVVVTDSTLKVKNASYRLNGITKLCLWTIRPDRWPGILLLLLGIVAIACGYMGVLPADLSIQTNNGSLDSNMVALWIGIALAVIGILVLALSKEKYAVRIGTAEGEKNAIVSYKREYIAQIVDALHSAFDLGHTSTPIIVDKK
jgi:hypothetical protein